ncbi:MAG: DUF6575 domain-containing protein [Prevotella sp.]|jgi:hypothetical protein
MTNILRLDKILDFYDVPQLFIARDKFEALYICLLYEDEPLCRYTAVRISGKRLSDFLTGNVDLREIFVNPENKGEYFDVAFSDNEYQIMPLSVSQLPEERLLEQG